MQESEKLLKGPSCPQSLGLRWVKGVHGPGAGLRRCVEGRAWAWRGGLGPPWPSVKAWSEPGLSGLALTSPHPVLRSLGGAQSTGSE